VGALVEGGRQRPAGGPRARRLRRVPPCDLLSRPAARRPRPQRLARWRQCSRLPAPAGQAWRLPERLSKGRDDTHDDAHVPGSRSCRLRAPQPMRALAQLPGPAAGKSEKQRGQAQGRHAYPPRPPGSGHMVCPGRRRHRAPQGRARTERATLSRYARYSVAPARAAAGSPPAASAGAAASPELAPHARTRA